MDLLVKLYELPPLEPAIARTVEAGVKIVRPIGPDRGAVVDWVAHNFSARWASEAAMAFSGHPISCFAALDGESNIIGFACYNATFRGFFGPTGVADEWRGKGIGTALLLRSLHALHEDGFAYGVIGWSSSDDFYKAAVGAIPIADSEPGPYADRIRGPE